MPEIPVDFTFLTNLVVVYGMNVLGALLLAIVGFWVAGLAERGVHRGLTASKRVDGTVAGFLSSLVRYGLLAVVLIAMLQLVGIQATSLLAVLGAASLAVGLALQGTLSNMAAGVMMLLFRPFRVGDQIEVAGKAGVVRELSLFFTELSTPENVKVLIPNASVWGTAVVNYSAYPTRRIEATVSAANGDADATAADLARFLDDNPKALATPAPTIVKTGYGEAIELSVRAWAPANDTGALKYEIDRFVAQRRMAREAASQAAEWPERSWKPSAQAAALLSRP